MTMQIDEVHKLLSIAELAHKWPHLKDIEAAALRLLGDHAKVAVKDNVDAKKAAEIEAAKANADAVAKAKAPLAPPPIRRPPDAPMLRRPSIADDTQTERRDNDA